jgi:hypothetical protein
MIANLNTSDWYFILTAVSKIAPFGPDKLAQKAKIVAAVNAHYQGLPTNG